MRLLFVGCSMLMLSAQADDYQADDREGNCGQDGVELRNLGG